MCPHQQRPCRPPRRWRPTLGAILLAAAPPISAPLAASELPSICWRQVDELPAGLTAIWRAADPGGGRLLASDGAHPAVRLDRPPGDAPPGPRPLVTVRGEDPQLFVRWPGGGVTWIWAREPAGGMRRLSAGLAVTPPAACVARGDAGQPALVVEALGQAGRQTCLAWSLAAEPDGAAVQRAACAPVGVPQLVGRPLAEARSVLDELELAVGSVEELAARQPASLVLSQKPAADSGVALATGDRIDLVIVGEELFGMPAIVGRSVAEARAILEPLQLALATASGGQPVALDQVLAYRVARQDPGADQTVGAGSRVTAEVALELPDLRGRPVPEALRELQELGLRGVTGGFAGTVPEAAEEFFVAAQRPEAGEPVAYGGEIAIDARIGAPNLRGLSLAEARRRLGDRGLELRRLPAAPADAAYERVRTQRPAPRRPLAPGAAISVNVGVLTPDIEGTTEDEARRRLSARGLGLTLVGRGPAGDPIEVPTATEHRLTAQRPGARALAAAGATVTAELEVRLPDLRGRDAAEAATEVRRVGFDPGRPRPRTLHGGLSQQVVGGRKVGAVVAQVPAPGSWLALGAPVQLLIGPDSVPPPPGPRWPWLWLALVAALGSTLLRPRKLPRRLRIEGHTDFGKQKLEAPAGSVGPPAVRLRPHWDPGRQAIEPAGERKGGPRG